jgi:hypothetical protein
LPKTADFDKWQGLKEMNNEEKGDYLNKLIVGVNTVEDKKFQKVYELAGKGSYYLPVHWFPSWKIFINDKIYQPVKFNSLGMPEVKVEKSTKVVLKYGQSNIQIIGNFVTMVTVLALAWLVFINKFKQKKILEFIT